MTEGVERSDHDAGVEDRDEHGEHRDADERRYENRSGDELRCGDGPRVVAELDHQYERGDRHRRCAFENEHPCDRRVFEPEREHDAEADDGRGEELERGRDADPVSVAPWSAPASSIQTRSNMSGIDESPTN